MTREENISRFKTPSDAIDIEKLERETRKLFFLGLLVAISIYAAIGSYFIFKKTEVKVVKPPAMELVIRRPRMTKAFVLKEKSFQQIIMRKKEIQQHKPSPNIRTKTISTMDLMVGSVASYDFDDDMQVNIDTDKYIHESIGIEMTATREPDKHISMKDEMISLEDLDTGQFRAMVIQDPNNKQDVKGFIYIPTVWGAQLRPPDSLKRAVINLKEAVNRYTNINARVDRHLFIDAEKLMGTPFVYITSTSAFELTEIERENFGKYLRNGGFAVIDNGTPLFEYGKAEASLRQLLRDSLGPDAKFLPIPNDHPLYHCFFDFDDGPPQGAEMAGMVNTSTSGRQGISAMNQKMTAQVFYLEGIWLKNRLVAIYSDKGYALKWKDMSNNVPQLKMGVNMVVFALTQEGSIAQQKMEFLSTVE